MGPYDPVQLPTCILVGEKMCMHNFQTRAAYGAYGVYTGSKNPYDHPQVTGILALMVPVNYPGAPCDLGIITSLRGPKGATAVSDDTLHIILDLTQDTTQTKITGVSVQNVLTGLRRKSQYRCVDEGFS